MSRVNETKISTQYPQRGRAFTANVRGVFAAIQLEFENTRKDIEGIEGGSIVVGEADLLDGQEGSFYRNAANLNAGTLADARVAESNVTQHEGALSLNASQVAEISNLTAAEGAQLENIDSVTIDNTQWGYLGALSSAPLEDNDLVDNGGSVLETSQLAANGGSIPETDRDNTFSGFIVTLGDGFTAENSSGRWFDAQVTNDSDSSVFRVIDSAGNVVGTIGSVNFDGAGGGYISLTGDWRSGADQLLDDGDLNANGGNVAEIDDVLAFAIALG